MTGLVPDKDCSDTSIYETILVLTLERLKLMNDPILNRFISYIDRDLIKTVSMPRLYGLTYYGMKDQIYSVINRELFNNTHSKDDISRFFLFM